MSSPYSLEAERLKYSEKKVYFRQILHLLAVISAIVLSIPEFFKLLIPKKPKSIARQLALVTGGSKGIGKAIAISLAEKGCNVAIASRNHQEGIKTAKDIEERFGVKAKAFKADVSSSEDIKKLKVDIESSLGCVDILVNNAAYLTLKFSLLEATDEEIQEVIDTNLTSYFWTVRAFLPGMMERKRGHIIAVSSIAAITSFPNCITYTTTKGGIDHFMNSLYEDLRWQGHDGYIKLTTVFPAPTATRRDYEKINDELIKMPLLDPSEVGRATVEAILQNRRKLSIPKSIGILYVLNCLPDSATKIAKMPMGKRTYDKNWLQNLRDNL